MNESKRIWRVKSASNCLAVQTKNIAEISESRGKIVLSCIPFHAPCPAVSCGEAARSSKVQRVEPSNVILFKTRYLGDISLSLLAGESSI